MELFKQAYQWQFTPTAQGFFGDFYHPIVWTSALLALFTLHCLMVILTKNSHANPLFFRAAIIGWSLVFLHAMIAPFVPLNLPVPVVRAGSALFIAIFIGAIASGRVSIAVKFDHKPVMHIDLAEEGKTK